ncbi:hypothetical protein GCM10023083_79970 [Streptomyces phyllanthi]
MTRQVNLVDLPVTFARPLSLVTYMEVADLMVSSHLRLRECPLNLAYVLKQAFGASVQDLHAVAWARGEMSQDQLRAVLNVSGRREG